MIFDRYIGIDYSGAEVPTSSLKGLRIYEGDRLTPPREVAPPKAPAGIGPAARSLNGLWQSLAPALPLSSASITDSRSQSATFKSMACPLTGLHFLMIFSNTGPLTTNILTSTSSATAYAETVPPARAIPVGGDLPNCTPARPSRFFTLMSPDLQQNPPTRVFHGCAICVGILVVGHTSGPLTDGRFRPTPL